MKNKIDKQINEVIEGYNSLIADEIKIAVEFARKYKYTTNEEIINFGQDRIKRLLLIKDEAIAKLKLM